MSQKPTPDEIASRQRYFAAQSNNRAWRLSELTARTTEENEEMLHAAHAAMYLWSSIGNAKNHAHAAQLLAHVYALHGRGEQASHYLSKSQTEFFGPEAQPWEVAIAHAVAANVAAANRNSQLHSEHFEKAKQLIAALPSAEERRIIEATLSVIPVPGSSANVA